VVLDGDLRVKWANSFFYREFRTTEEETIGRFVFDSGNGDWNVPAVRKLLERIEQGGIGRGGRGRAMNSRLWDAATSR
jgi:hypothetical protein